MTWQLSGIAAIGMAAIWATLSAPITAPPRVHDAAATRDIAFASRRDGNWELYVMDASGGNQRRLTNRDAEDRFPLWSPEGGQIAFGSQVGDSWELWVMNADGTKQRRLASHIVAKSTRGWSPDGKRMVFAAFTDSIISGISSNVDIFTVDVRSGEIARLTSASGEDHDPSWSPDGAHVAFSSSRNGTPQVFVMDADGGNQRLLTSMARAAAVPRWSPDSRSLVFSAGSNDDRDLYVIAGSGGVPQRVTTGAHVTRDAPLWSPDGSRVAFQIAVGVNYNIGVVKLTDTPHSYALLAASTAYDGSYTWSPDGRQVAFISSRDGFDAVYVVDAEGGGAVRLTGSASLTPAWGSQR